MSGKYRTIVADPPWDHSDGTGLPSAYDDEGRPFLDYGRPKRPPPYGLMSVSQIMALPVASAGTDDAHLFLWTTNRYLQDAFKIVHVWQFGFVKLLIWCKPPKAPFIGGTFGGSSVEFCLYAKRKDARALGRAGRQWWEWPRGAHSAKPEAFLDIIETVCPGPYLELFARRARFGWDYWGDESLGTAEMPEAVT